MLKKLLESKQEPPQEPEKERDAAEVETEPDSAEVIPEEMDAAEENEWRQRPLRVSVKEQEITREELTATVLQRYLQNNHRSLSSWKSGIRKKGTAPWEVGKLSYAFLFFEDLIQFDISAKRKGGRSWKKIGNREKGAGGTVPYVKGRVMPAAF